MTCYLLRTTQGGPLGRSEHESLEACLREARYWDSQGSRRLLALPVVDQRDPTSGVLRDRIRDCGETWRDLDKRHGASGVSESIGVSRDRLVVSLGISGVFGMRDPESGDADRILESLLEEAESLLADWHECGDDWAEKDSGHGGRCVSLPVALVLSNYGGSLYADRAFTRTRFFDGLRD